MIASSSEFLCSPERTLITQLEISAEILYGGHVN